ncbi:hypothetical protein PHPALM_27857 [Phytophthora palmivora]|uniref:HAT C-terminal dimerisation domain-containing protein n=1 Tax=Phytophthora palmivora TaxID=4796 RepID=A0A2P4XBK4_9STRA|nr:hypothetical protein PHPALM_27857 [Phytophthora palmivora]
MVCAVLGCQEGDELTTNPCSVCGKPTHHFARKTRDEVKESEMNAEADGIMREWLELEPERLDVAQRQNPEITNADLTKDMSIDAHNYMYWSLLGLYKRVDVLRWFRDEGQALFLSIALLVRIHLGKISSSAFRERVFSTGGIVMGPLRTRTDSRRAEKQLLLLHNRDEIVQLKQDAAKRKAAKFKNICVHTCGEVQVGSNKQFPTTGNSSEGLQSSRTRTVVIGTGREYKCVCPGGRQAAEKNAIRITYCQLEHNHRLTSQSYNSHPCNRIVLDDPQLRTVDMLRKYGIKKSGILKHLMEYTDSNPNPKDVQHLVRKLKARERRDRPSSSYKLLKTWMKQFGDASGNVGRIFLDDVSGKVNEMM